MTKPLYYGSLEEHMRQYMKDVKLNQLNNDYQLAQQAIVREGESMNLSKAEILNKIEMMRQSLKDNIARKLLAQEAQPVVPLKQIKIKKISPFKQELTQKLDERTKLKKIQPSKLLLSSISTEETKPKRKKPIASIASEAPTESTSTTAQVGSNPTSPAKPTTGDNMTLKKTITDRYKALGVEIPTELSKKGGVKNDILIQFSAEIEQLEQKKSRSVGSGLRKRKKSKK